MHVMYQGNQYNNMDSLTTNAVPKLGTRARHVVVKDAEHLLHPRVVSEGDIASSGNKNDTIGEIIVNFFHQHKWVREVSEYCEQIHPETLKHVLENFKNYDGGSLVEFAIC